MKMPRREITYDDVYDIAAEVAEETITKFLQNLVKLVPQAEDIVDDIQANQYEELQELRELRAMKQHGEFTGHSSRSPQRFTEQRARDDEFAQIARPSKANSNKLDVDDALAEIPLEASDLFGAASTSPVDNNIIPVAGVEE